MCDLDVSSSQSNFSQ